SYTDLAHLAEVRTVLSRCRHVVRVLPSPDREISLPLLRQRCTATKGQSWIIDGHDFLEQWLDDPGARQMATRTIYTNNETPAQTAARLIRYG
ncbi:hypothetical protein ACWFRM_43565, partial [Streptomyces sp. NPDC055144]